VIRAAAIVVASAVTVAALAWATMMRRPAASGVDADTRAASAAFLHRYVAPDGRVVRLDQGGDTVSEGQAYAMLISVASGDRSTFDRTWSWARTHLQRRDGLLSWRWQGNAVADAMPATDADLDAAWALQLAANRFHQRRYATAAQTLSRGIIDNETAGASGHPVLVAGPWARSVPATVNPSYAAPPAMNTLLSTDARWRDVMVTSRKNIDDVTQSETRLPPEWASLESNGRVTPSGGPGNDGGTARYGLQAARVFSWWAASCHADDRQVVARLAGLLQSGSADASSRSLDGAVVDSAPHATTTVAAAAAAAASGHHSDARRLLAQASDLDRAHPSYYGAAWVALGRILLTSSALGGCRP
jgi:endoglucanase